MPSAIGDLDGTATIPDGAAFALVWANFSLPNASFEFAYAVPGTAADFTPPGPTLGTLTVFHDADADGVRERDPGVYRAAEVHAAETQHDEHRQHERELGRRETRPRPAPRAFRGDPQGSAPPADRVSRDHRRAWNSSPGEGLLSRKQVSTRWSVGVME